MRHELPTPPSRLPPPRPLTAIVAELDALRLRSARITERMAVVRAELLGAMARAAAATN